MRSAHAEASLAKVVCNRRKIIPTVSDTGSKLD
jgi:hypothetical protein